MALLELTVGELLRVRRGAEIGLGLRGYYKPGRAGSPEQLTAKLAAVEAELVRRGVNMDAINDENSRGVQLCTRCKRYPARYDGLCLGCQPGAGSREDGTRNTEHGETENGTRNTEHAGETMAPVICETCGQACATATGLAVHRARRHGAGKAGKTEHGTRNTEHAGGSLPGSGFPATGSASPAGSGRRFLDGLAEGLGLIGWPVANGHCLANQRTGQAVRIDADCEIHRGKVAVTFDE
jgi:hypothetical protein